MEHALRGAALWDEVKDKLHKSRCRGIRLEQQQRLAICAGDRHEPTVLLYGRAMLGDRSNCDAQDRRIDVRIEEACGTTIAIGRDAQWCNRSPSKPTRRASL